MEIKVITPEETLDIRQKVMWPDKSIDFVKVPEDQEGTHYGLFLNDRLISVISLFYKDNTLQFRKFATLGEEQGKGYGTALLNFVMALAESQGIQRIWCNARVHKKVFYEQFGMKSTLEAFDKDGASYVIMEKIM